MSRFFSIAVPCAALVGAVLRGAPATVSAPRVEVVGPSVLLNARDNGAVRVLDLRAVGRAVPGATRVYRSGAAPLFVLGDEKTARVWLCNHDARAAFIVVPQMIEYAKLNGVPQLSPRVARAQVTRQKWPLFDISEAFEFRKSRLPGSVRFDYNAFLRGAWAPLPRGKPFIVACRVGHRSQLVVQELRKAGYDARNLDGGLWQWECDGLKVERGGA